MAQALDLSAPDVQLKPEIVKPAAMVEPRPQALPINDASGDFLRTTKQAEIERVRAAAQQNIQQAEKAGLIEKPPEPEKPEQGIGGMAVSAIKDVGRGVIETPTQMLGGVYEAGRQTLKAIDDLGWWLNDNVADLDFGAGEGKEGRKNLLNAAPEFGAEPKSLTGGAVRGMSQFLAGFVPVLGQMGKMGTATTLLGRAAQIEGAAAISSALVFDPHEERLSNLIESVPALQNPVTNYLKADKADTNAGGRLKNALEGLGFGAAAEGALRGIRAIKFNRIDRGVKPEAVLGEGDAPLESVVKSLGSPDEPLVILPADKDPSEFMGRLAAGKGGNLPFQMNWSKFTSSEDIQEATNNVAKLFKGQFDEARRGEISDKELTALAERIGMTPQDLLSRQKGGVFNAERILAAKTIVEASADKLIELGRVARTSTDTSDLYAFQRMLGIHGALQKEFQGAASEAGRALRSLQLPVGSKAKQVRDIEEMLNIVGGPDKVRSMAEAISQINDPNQISRVARDSVGKRAADAVTEAWYFALLSGPQTHAVNMLSSSLNALWMIPERAVASRFAALRGATDSVQEGEAAAMFYGMVGSFTDGMRAMGRALLRGEGSDVFQKTEARTFEAITAEKFGLTGPDGSIGQFFGKAVDGLGTVTRMPSRFLMAEDEFFQVIGKSMQVRSLAIRQVRTEGLEGAAAAKRMAQIIQNPTDEMMESALDFSRSITFTTPLGEAGRSFQRGINKMPIFKVAMPFVRTPVNLGKWAGTHSPLAPLAASVRADIAGGGPKADLAMSKITMGSMVMLSMADLALRGVATGSGPTDPELSRVWRQKYQPYSIKVGNTWYSYNRSDPFGMLMGVASDYAAIAGEIGQRDAEDIAAAAALAASKSVFSKTWMRGPSELVEALHDPERYGPRYVQGLLGTFLVPTGVAQVARAMDPEWREVNGIVDAIKARTPGYSQTLPPRRNIWGEKILNQGGLGPDIISPIYKFDSADKPIDSYMIENRIPVQMPAKVVFGTELTPKEYDRFVELAGNGLKDPSTGMGAYDTLNAIVEGKHNLSSQWQRSSDGPQGGRSVIVRSVIQSFRDAARAKVVEEFPDLRARVGGRLEERGRAMEETIMFPQGGRLP